MIQANILDVKSTSLTQKKKYLRSSLFHDIITTYSHFWYLVATNKSQITRRKLKNDKLIMANIDLTESILDVCLSSEK